MSILRLNTISIDTVKCNFGYLLANNSIKVYNKLRIAYKRR